MNETHEDLPPASNRAGLTARVLLVDDDPVLLRVLAEVLSLRLPSMKVEACSSPVAALSSISTTDYDVVVTDLLMAGLHGLELLDRIKEMRPSSMVVLITGAADRDLSVRALRGGAYDFIQKPVDADYLAASIRRAIETRRLRAEVERQQASLRAHAEDLERTVAERTDQLLRASAAKDEFLATISHELRTPLTSILGWARLLSSGRLTEDAHGQAVESIARNAQSQAQLIDDLLDVSRIISGKLRIGAETLNLTTVIDAALSVVFPSAKAKGIAIESFVDPGLPPISGDPERLQQVLWNLLSNAIKFTPSGGRIRIRVTRDGTVMAVRVEDTGVGIEAEFLPFIFDRFRQADSTHFSSRRGLGLGLAIARHLVLLHGGKLIAESAGRDAGATFTVLLPCSSAYRVGSSDPAAATDRKDGDPPSDLLRGVRVLIVNDEDDTRQMLALTVAQVGALVRTASSVAGAREAFSQDPPDVLLCHIGLGQQDGYAFIREVRQLPASRGGDVPAIALTGAARAGEPERALEAGFGLLLANPGAPDLALVIAGLLKREVT